MFDHAQPTKETPMPSKKPPKATTIKELAQSRADVFYIDPDAVVLITEKGHELYDERVNLPLDEGIVSSIIEHGVQEPVKLRKNGDEFEVVSGRQRVKNAREANRRLRSAGKEPISIPVQVVRGDDLKMASLNATLNTKRIAETPLTIAQKVVQMIEQFGDSKEHAAEQFGLTVSELNQHLKLLDCSSKVTKLVNEGHLAVATAAKLSALPRAEQDKKVDELKAGVGLNRNTVRNVVKEARAAKAENREMRDVLQAPKRSLVVAVCGAYAKSPAVVQPAMLLSWTLTGAHADELPGPVIGQTLAQWVVGYNAPAVGAKA